MRLEISPRLDPQNRCSDEISLRNQGRAFHLRPTRTALALSPRQEIERLKAYIAELEAEIERLKEELAKKPTVLTSPLNHLAGGRKVCSY